MNCFGTTTFTAIIVLNRLIAIVTISEDANKMYSKSQS